MACNKKLNHRIIDILLLINNTLKVCKAEFSLQKTHSLTKASHPVGFLSNKSLNCHPISLVLPFLSCRVPLDTMGQWLAFWSLTIYRGAEFHGRIFFSIGYNVRSLHCSASRWKDNGLTALSPNLAHTHWLWPCLLLGMCSDYFYFILCSFEFLFNLLVNFLKRLFLIKVGKWIHWSLTNF